MTTVDATPTPEGTPRRSRRRGTFADLLRSLGLVAIMLLALMFYARLGTPSHPAPNGDAASIVTAARSAAPFPVLAPEELPKGWYANAATFDAVPGEDGHWRFHIGFTDGSTRYAGIQASNAADASTLLPAAPAALAGQPVRAAGLTFTGYRSPDTPGDESWVAQGTGSDGGRFVIRIDGSGNDVTTFTRTLMASLSANGAVAVG